MRLLFFSFLLLFSINFLKAQSIGIGTSSPHASAQLDIVSPLNNKGLLIPRMTSAQRIAIPSPANGLLVYETTTNSFWYYNSSVWNQLGTGGASPWTISGTNIYSSNTGNVGIGISSPIQKFHLVGDFQQDNGAVILNTPGAIVQFQNAGVNKTFFQQSGNNLRMGTSSGNELGKMIFRMDGSDKIFIDSTGNMQITGEQDASLTTHGYLTLGSVTSNNVIIDNNEIMARNNGAADDLVLQNDGGNIGIGVASPDERLTLTSNIKLNGSAGLIKFETAVGGTGSPISSSRYAPGLQFLREGTTTNLAKIEYVDTSGFANFLRLRVGTNVENGITLNTSNYTGLGTQDPLARLHVRGEAGADEIAINSGSGLSNETAAIQFYSTGFVGGGAVTKKTFVMLDDNDMKIGTNSGNTAGKFIIRTNGSDKVSVDNNGNTDIAGSLGVTGNTDISGSLGVTGNTNISGSLGITGNTDIAGRLSVTKNGEALKIDGSSPVINFYEAGNFKSFISHSNAGLYLGVNNGNIRLDMTNGHVAIGNIVLTGPNASAYKLAVSGKIICEEVKVKLASSGWPDYVFADNYKLRPLADVEKFIEQNKHLPNIQSAAEIEKDGISVGDMQKRMMEKIEELTLYIIELQKQVDELKKKQ